MVKLSGMMKGTSSSLYVSGSRWVGSRTSVTLAGCGSGSGSGLRHSDNSEMGLHSRQLQMKKGDRNVTDIGIVS